MIKIITRTFTGRNAWTSFFMIFKIIMRFLLSSLTSLTFFSFSAFYENIHTIFDNYRNHKNDHQNERNCPTKLVYYLYLRTTLEFESLKKFWFVFLTIYDSLIHDKSFVVFRFYRDNILMFFSYHHQPTTFLFFESQRNEYKLIWKNVSNKISILPEARSKMCGSL